MRCDTFSAEVGGTPSVGTAIETLSTEISGADERAAVAPTARGQAMGTGRLGASAFQPGAFQADAFQVQTDTTQSRESAFELLQARVADGRRNHWA